MLHQAKALSQELIRLRRDFHRHPELGFQEVRTAKVVAETLQEIGGINIRTGVGKTGVIADLGTGTGPTIAIRADMDALPILEKTGADYNSVHPGVMHACGHDAHTAILLGVAHLLKDTFAQNNLLGNVRFLFQPAEEVSDDEGISGAPRMIEDGARQALTNLTAVRPYVPAQPTTITVELGSVDNAAQFRGRAGVEVVEPLKVVSRATDWMTAWNQIWPLA